MRWADIDRCLCDTSDFYGGWVHKGITGKMKGGKSDIAC